MEPLILPQLFAETVRLHGSSIAIEIPPGLGRPRRLQLTYAQLDGRAKILARELALTLAGESIVPLLLGRDSIHLLPSQIAAMYAGGAYCCLDPTLPDERLAFMLSDCEAKVLVTEASHVDRARSLVSDATQVVVMEDTLASPLQQEAHELPAWVGPQSLAYVIYTSGTTGRPKGVLVEHGSIANLVATDVERFSLTPRDRVAQGSSPSYDSSVEEIWLALSVGATVVVLDAETTRLGPDLIDWLRRERISVFCPPPTLLRASGCSDPGRHLPDMKLLYVGGEPLDATIAATWGEPFWLENGYGPTECTVTSLRCRVEPHEPISIGEPVAGIEAFVLDEEGQVLGRGHPGELCLSGIGLARGYLNLPEETASRFPKHPQLGRIYRTGDLAVQEPNGQFTCFGRVDSQVKIRGHRIELEEVDSHLVRCSGIREAACKVQKQNGTSMLVAWLVPEGNKLPAGGALRDELALHLPTHMIPSRFDFMSELPKSVGGKLDRKSLPSISCQEATSASFGPCEGEIPCLIEEAMKEVLGREDGISSTANFFDSLEGDSLKAAMVISALRSYPKTSHLAVRDIYQAPTIAGLADRVEQQEQEDFQSSETQRTEAPRRSPMGAGIIQGVILLFALLLSGPVVWFGIDRVLPYVLSHVDLIPLLIGLPLVLSVLGLLLIPFSFAFVIAMKWLLIGKYVAMRRPVYGSFYLRNWLVQRFVQVLPWGLIAGTVFQNTALRLLGASIGRRVHIHRGVNLLHGGWDLLEIGDDATIGQDAALRLIDYEDGQIVVAPVVVGAKAVIETRAGVNGFGVVEEGGWLTALSVVEENGRVGQDEMWDGVPATLLRSTPSLPDLDRPQEMSPLIHGILSIAFGVSVGFVFALPFLLLSLFFVDRYAISSDRVLSWLAAPHLSPTLILILVTTALIAGPIGLLMQALYCRLLGPIPVGCISRWSWDYIRVWTKTAAVNRANGWLSGTLFWPWWLRAAGMKIGRNSEVSTIIDVVPELIEIGEQSFFADGIYLGGPRIQQGRVTLALTKLGCNTFLGNHGVVESGAALPPDILLGICTKSHRGVKVASSWFGHPAFELPRREVIDMPRSLTHEPGLFLFAQRLFWESLRFALPLFSLLTSVVWLMAVLACLKRESIAEAAFIWIPLFTGALGLVHCCAVLVVKWSLLGRVKPGQHGFWSSWCSRWDFLYVTWGAWAQGILTTFEGTPFIHWYLRAMGVRIGRNVILTGGFAQVVDPDMIILEDGATVNGLFQAHSFEDRVLKMDWVRVGPQATTHDGSVLLYGADVGAHTTVSHHSVVMKHERLLANKRYCGVPTTAMGPSNR